MKADLEVLADRVKALTGPSFLVEQEIADAVGHNPRARLPNYTASIDAAMTLVPGGLAWVLYSDGPTYVASAEIGFHPTGGELFVGRWSSDGENPAIALTAAALRAQAAQSDQ